MYQRKAVFTRHKVRAVLMGMCVAAAIAALGAANHANATTTAGHAASAKGLTHAKQQVAKLTGVDASFEAPGKPFNAKKLLKGKTVYFSPIFLQAPFLQTEATVMGRIVTSLGGKLQVCDVKDDPSAAASCMGQAVSSHAAGIITASVPYVFAQQAYQNAVNHKVVVIAGDTVLPFPRTGAFAKYLMPLDFGQANIGAQEADSIIANSSGHANVLFVEDASTPATSRVGASALTEFKSYCSGCTVQTMTFEDDQLQNLGTLVSSALLKDPGAQYVMTQYDDPSGSIVAPTVQQANRGLKFVSGSANLSSIPRVESGEQYADVGYDPAIAAYDSVDELLRTLDHHPLNPAQYVDPHRIFTKANVGSISGKLSESAWETGAWYTSVHFRTQFDKNWGL
jgi:ribose transport system substrate-binding protein